MICSYFLVLDTLQSNPAVFQLEEHCSNPSETSPDRECEGFHSVAVQVRSQFTDCMGSCS